MDTGIIRQGEIVGRDIMIYETTEVVGAVDHVLVVVKQAAVVGLSYKAPGLVGKRQPVSWNSIASIGADCVVLHSNTAAGPELATAQSITNLEVWTDGGEHIGRIVDICFDRSSGTVQQYLLLPKNDVDKGATNEPTNWAEAEPTAALFGEEENEESLDSAEENTDTGTALVLLPGAIISAGQKRMMISEEDAKNMHPYGQTIHIAAQKSGVLPAADWIGEQLPALPTDVNSLLQKGQAFAGKVTDQVKQRTQQLTREQLNNPNAKEPSDLPDITEQLQEKTEQVRDQMQQQLRRAQEKAAEQLKKSQLEEKLGNTSLGRSLGKTLNRFTRSKPHPEPAEKDPIDIASFEVWEDD
ncbi:MAG: hypothetical protein AAFR12_08445 [Cyanobacteria bacterium J06626_6]